MMIDFIMVFVDCNGIIILVVGGFLIDQNNDGDLCDVGIDGFFFEGQLFGDLLQYVGCQVVLDLVLMIVSYVIQFGIGGDVCLLYFDFGFVLLLLLLIDQIELFCYWKCNFDEVEFYFGFDFCGYLIDSQCKVKIFLSLCGLSVRVFV